MTTCTPREPLNRGISCPELIQRPVIAGYPAGTWRLPDSDHSLLERWYA